MKRFHADPAGALRGHRISAWRHGEKGLNSCAGGMRLQISEARPLSIEGQGTFSVHCSSGTLWVTELGCSTDTVLGEGEEIEAAAKGTAQRIVKRPSRSG